MAEIEFRYMSKIDPFDYVKTLSHAMNVRFGFHF